MDSIQEIISTLNEEDCSGFRRFLKRTKGNEDRKDLQLFNLFVSNENESTRHFELELYPKGNNVSYQAVRKRLTRLLTRFIALKLMDSDSSDASHVLSLVNMARYLFGHNLGHQAWKYLIKAERAADKNELFEILNTIYVLQIQHLPTNSPMNHEELIEKWKKNKKQLEDTEQGEIALSLVSRKIDEAGKMGEYQSIDSLIKASLNDLNLEEDYLLQPRFVYHIASMNRKKMLREKDYFNLEPFLIEQFELINNRSGFRQKHNYFKLGFLYMICHTLFRNRKFEESFDYLNSLEKELESAPKSLQNEFYPKTILLKANLFLFQNKLSLSIQLLEKTYKKPPVIFSQKDRLNVITNLGVAYFYNEEPLKTKKVLLEINHSDKWCEKIMGKEWVLKKSIMEVILHIELEEQSLVDSRLRYLQRSFRDVLIQPKYKRVATYIKFLRRIGDAPIPNKMELIEKEIEGSFEWIPMEREDLQAIAFYAWLKSKVTNKTQYELLLELVKRK